VWCKTFRDSFFNHTSTAIIMKSMPVFDGTIRNVTYENLELYNVRTGVCINTAAQECFNRGGMAHESVAYTITYLRTCYDIV
jgi:polygalacturonase